MTPVNKEQVVTSNEFSRVLDARVGGNEILAALNRNAALMLRFEVKGRATVGGFEYRREHQAPALPILKVGLTPAVVDALENFLDRLRAQHYANPRISVTRDVYGSD